MPVRRGALIVFEGCDRCGKSTQLKMLADWLRARDLPVEVKHFPDRGTMLGKMIDSYLKQTSSLQDEAIHLLFSANRWEAVPGILNALNQGITLLIDRYAYSGVAYSAAKGLDLNWCRIPDAGLPRPDLVVFLDLKPELASQRGGFGEERYEKLEFQNKVYSIYEKLRSDEWAVISADGSVDEVHQAICAAVSDLVDRPISDPIEKLWIESISF